MIDTVEKQYIQNQFVSYRMILSNGKEFSVPLDEANTDYKKIQQWISEGNTVIDNGE
jgi:hypothetical protein